MKILALAITAALILVSGVSLAAEPKPEPERASFDVTVIDAKKTPGEIDPKLEHLKDVLERSFKGYKSFRQVNRSKFSVVQGAAHTMTLVGSQELKVSLSPGGAKGFLKVSLVSGDLKTTVDVKNGGLFFQAVRGPQGAALVIAIRATRLAPDRAR